MLTRNCSPKCLRCALKKIFEITGKHYPLPAMSSAQTLIWNAFFEDDTPPLHEDLQEGDLILQYLESNSWEGNPGLQGKITLLGTGEELLINNNDNGTLFYVKGDVAQFPRGSKVLLEFNGARVPSVVVDRDAEYPVLYLLQDTVPPEWVDGSLDSWPPESEWPLRKRIMGEAILDFGIDFDNATDALGKIAGLYPEFYRQLSVDDLFRFIDAADYNRFALAGETVRMFAGMYGLAMLELWDRIKAGIIEKEQCVRMLGYAGFDPLLSRMFTDYGTVPTRKFSSQETECCGGGPRDRIYSEVESLRLFVEDRSKALPPQ